MFYAVRVPWYTVVELYPVNVEKGIKGSFCAFVCFGFSAMFFCHLLSLAFLFESRRVSFCEISSCVCGVWVCVCVLGVGLGHCLKVASMLLSFPAENLSSYYYSFQFYAHAMLVFVVAVTFGDCASLGYRKWCGWRKKKYLSVCSHQY